MSLAEYATSIDIQAPPDVVYAHLVTPERMVSWMGEHADLEPVPGGRFSVDINGALVRGEYLELEPPHRVVLSWGMAGRDDLPPGASRVEFILTPLGSGTRLSLVHSGLPDVAARRHGIGWAHYLSRLQLSATGTAPGPDTLHLQTALETGNRS
jgi:uncharacterized protein YndB with AHSA1/START domain